MHSICYYVLLKVGTHFKYAALQHVHGAGHSRGDMSEEWDEDTPFEGHPPTANQLASFVPKSVSAVAKDAAKYVKKLAADEGEKPEQHKKKPKVAQKQKQTRGKAVASDAESDAGDGEDGEESDV